MEKIAWSDMLRPALLSLIPAILMIPAIAIAGDSRLSAGGEWISLHYEEPAVMEEDGSLYGVLLVHEATLGPVPIRSTALLAYGGSIQYDGGVSLENDEYLPLRLKTENWLANARSTGSWPIRRQGSRATWFPYAGLGWRLLVDNLPTRWGYVREQTYWYAPIGMETKVDAGRGVTCFLAGEYDCFLRGWNVSAGDTFVQHGGAGFRLSVAAEIALDDENGVDSFRLESFLQGWEVDKSTTSASGYYEPANSSVLYGISASVVF